jgi:hypothetical protein
MNGILARLGAKIKRKTLSENLCFARHMAIRIVPLNIWADKSLQYKDRFKQGGYWGHQGSMSVSDKPKNGIDGAGEQWNNEAIELKYPGNLELQLLAKSN